MNKPKLTLTIDLNKSQYQYLADQEHLTGVPKKLQVKRALTYYIQHQKNISGCVGAPI